MSNFDLFDWVKKLGIKHFRGVFSRDALPKKMRKECGIVNLDDNQGPGKHWVCYKNLENDFVEYFDSLGLVMPNEIYNYLLTSWKNLFTLTMNYKIEILFYVVAGVCIIWTNDKKEKVF